MVDINKMLMECMKSFHTIPSQKEFKDRFPKEYGTITEKGYDFNEILILNGYDPYKSVLTNYNYLNEDEIYELIRLTIIDFKNKYSYIPNEQIYKILPLPSLQYLKVRYNISYSNLLKKIDCDKINGFKIFRHVPNEVLLKRVREKVDSYLKQHKKLPNKKAFTQFKIGSVNFYEKRFEKSYYELLESMGYSLTLKHKPLIYKDYTDDEIFDLTKGEITGYVEKHGEVPTQFEYRKLNAPSEIYFKRKYNLTYNELLMKLGFEPINCGEKYKYMSDDVVLEKIKEEINSFVGEKDRLPNAEEFLLLAVPSLGFFKKRFNFTYKELIKHLGYNEIDFIEGYFGLNDNQVLMKIKKVLEDHTKQMGKLPTQKQYNNLPVPSSYLIKKLYGLSYKGLLKELGLIE